MRMGPHHMMPRDTAAVKDATLARATARRVWSFAKPYRGTIGIFLVSIVVAALLALVPPLVVRRIIDVAIPESDRTAIWWLAALAVAAALADAVLQIVQRWCSARVGEGLIADLRRALYTKVQRLPLAFFTRTPTGAITSRLNNDVVGAQTAVTSTLGSVVSNVIVLVTTAATMFVLEWRLTLLAVAVLPIFIFTARQVGRRLRVVRRQQLQENAAMNSVMQEVLSVSGALLAKLFARQRDEDARFNDKAGAVRDLGVRQALIGRWFFMLLGVASAVGSAVVFWVGAVMVINNSLSVGDLVALSFYLNALYGPLSSLSNARVEFATALVSFERVFEVVDLEHDIAERPDGHVLGDVKGRVEFDNVSFSYALAPSAELSSVQRHGHAAPDAEYGAVAADGRWALRNVSFVIEPGELVALVGPSGAGKTSTTYLVPRLYDVTEGAVRIDGHDVRDVTLESLAHAIGIVTQEAYLFHDTIAANLRYAKPDAGDDELMAAVEAANIAEFLDRLPDGLATVVGERGYRLSGGEKQRVAIARVILKDPRVLILDEATSHLDAQSEALVQDALERVMQDRSSLVIAHRLSTILAADRILVMNEGSVVETGNHAELLERGGLYADLYQTQFRHSRGAVPS